MRDDLLCVFELSPHGRRLSLDGAKEIVGPAAGKLDDGTLTLDPNGWAFILTEGDAAVSSS